MRAIRTYRRAARRARAGPVRAGATVSRPAPSTMAQDGDLAVVQDLGGLAAEQQPLDAAVAVPCPDDPVASLGLAGPEDGLVARLVGIAQGFARQVEGEGGA